MAKPTLLSPFHSILSFVEKKDVIVPTEKKLNDQDRENFIALATANNAQILTASRRQNRYYQDILRNHFAQQHNCWPAVKVSTLDDWLANISQRALSRCSELYLWQRSLHTLEQQQPEVAVALHNTQQVMTTLAMDAAKDCNLWQIATTRPEFTDTDESQIFANWHQLFEQSCRSKNCHNSSQALRDAKHILEHTELPPSILLVGFIELNPAQRQLVQLLTKRGCQVTVYTPPAQQPTIYRHHYEQRSDEIPAIAQKAAQWFHETGADTGEQTLAIIVPDLASQWIEVFSTFSRAIYPNDNSATILERETRALNLSGGIALSALPLIDSAMRILQLSADSTLADVSALLHQPTLGIAISPKQRRRILQRVNRGDSRSLQQASALLAEAPELIAELTNNQYWQKKDYPSRLVNRLTQRLNTVGWLHNISLSSSEYQQYQHWLDQLHSIIAMDDLDSTMSMREVLNLLKDLLHSTLFQPATKGARIHILGLYEASGLWFDRLWITGLSDQVLPITARPSPLIPLTLQRRQCIVSSHAGYSFRYSQALWRSLQACAGVIHTSSAGFDGETPIAASPFISRLEITQPTQHTTETSDTPLLETYKQEQLPTPTTGDNSTQPKHYPSHLLEAQSACSMQAALAYRLGLRDSTDSFYPGALEMGTLIHNLMEKVLTSMFHESAPSNYQTLCRDIVNQQIQALAEKQPWLDNSPAARQISDQVYQQVYNWITREQQQRKDYHITSMEESFQIQIGPLNFSFRIDRIDTINNQEGAGALLIDYKTGHVEAKGWNSERPKKPQLLAYALAVAAHQPVVGISFISLKLNESGFVITGDELVQNSFTESDTGKKDAGKKNIIKSKQWRATQQWQQWLHEQTSHITTLANDFATGVVQLNPRDTDACTYCPYISVCRIKTALRQQPDSSA